MPYTKNRIPLPSMTPGTSRSIAWLRFGKAGARPKVYMQASIHANELPGAMLIHHLMPMLVEADAAGRIEGEIVVVPTVNPIGQSQIVGNSHFGRYDLASRENFNRNWPDLSDAVAGRVGAKLGRDAAANVALIRKAARAELRSMQPMNELQTLRVEMMKLSIDADICMDLHCDQQAALHLFTAKPDVDGGSAQEFAADMGVVSTMYNEPYAEALTFSGVNGALWPRLAKLLPDAAIPQGCFSSTLELRSQHDVSHAQGVADAKNLYRYLVRKGAIAGRAGPLPRLKSAPTPISGMDVGYCPAPGFITYRVPAGAKVRKGQVICEIIDPADPRGAKARTPMLSRTDGILFSRRRDGLIAWPGMVCYRIAGPKPLAHRRGMSGLDD
jgi:predicted deacylase